MQMMASGHQKGQDDFPHEVKVQMKQFQDLLGQLRTALKPLTENRMTVDEELDERTKSLTSAQTDLTACYAVNSLFWGESTLGASVPVSRKDSSAYLMASGQNAKEHDVKRELNRLKVSMCRLREVTGRERRPNMRLDVPAASRMLKHSLPADQQLVHQEEDEDEENGRKRKKLKT